MFLSILAFVPVLWAPCLPSNTLPPFKCQVPRPQSPPKFCQVLSPSQTPHNPQGPHPPFGNNLIFINGLRCFEGGVLFYNPLVSLKTFRKWLYSANVLLLMSFGISQHQLEELVLLIPGEFELSPLGFWIAGYRLAPHSPGFPPISFVGPSWSPTMPFLLPYGQVAPGFWPWICGLFTVCLLPSQKFSPHSFSYHSLVANSQSS